MKKIVLLLSSLFITFFHLLTAKDLSERYLKCLSEADSLVKLSNYAEAEIKFSEAIEAEPDNPMNVLLMSNIGLMRHYSGSDTLALEILDKAASLAPSSVTVRSNKAKVLASLNLLIQAEAEYESIALLDSTIAEPLYMQTLINLRQGNISKADSISARLIKRFPDNLQAQEARAYFLVASSKYEKAIPLLNTVIKADPSASNYSQRAFCHLMLENLNDASADITSALNLDPMNAELYAYRAALNKMRYRPDDADNDARHAMQLGASRKQLQQLGVL